MDPDFLTTTIVVPELARCSQRKFHPRVLCPPVIVGYVESIVKLCEMTLFKNLIIVEIRLPFRNVRQRKHHNT